MGVEEAGEIADCGKCGGLSLCGLESARMEELVEQLTSRRKKRTSR